MGPGNPDDSPRDRRPLTERWAALGRVWREMTAQSRIVVPWEPRRRPPDPWRERIRKWWDIQRGRGPRPPEVAPHVVLQGLEETLWSALDALPAWPSLRAAVETRWRHLIGAKGTTTCYAMDELGWSMVSRHYDVEDRLSELVDLAEEGRVSPDTLRAAARMLANHAEYSLALRDLLDSARPERFARMDDLARRYLQDELQPSPLAARAGERLAELTVDRLGDLAGPPQEGEGLP